MPQRGEIIRGYKKSTHRHMWIACPHCGKERWVQLRFEKPIYERCQKCQQQQGAANSNWKGGRCRTGAGYIVIYAPGHHRATKKHYVYEHTLVWEQTHNETLPDNWLVHHLNGIKDDNQPGNLASMPRGKHHLAMHLEALKQRIRELEAEISCYRRIAAVYAVERVKGAQ